jgi:PAS domain S-box-containing protein
MNHHEANLPSNVHSRGELLRVEGLGGAIEVTRQTFEASLDAAAANILVIGPDERITLANTAAASALGWEARELIGQPAGWTFHRAGTANSDWPLHTTLRHGLALQSDDDVLHRQDGSSFPAETRWHPLCDARGRIIGAVVTFRDITRQLREQEQLRQWAQLLDLSQDAIIVRDFENRRIRFWSKGAERLYGWTAEEAADEPLCELILGGDRSPVDRINRELAETGEWAGELKQLTKQGAKIVVHGRARLMRGEYDGADAVLIINTDLTEKREIESQLLRAQRIESIGTLASGVAHDLNNILAPIMMSVSLLRRDMPAEKRDELVSVVEIAARRGAQIVRQVLTFGRGVEGERHPLMLGALIGELVKIMRETFPKDIAVSTSVPRDLWPVVGDATQLHQVLLNLCVNARDAMPRGGRMQICASNLDLDANYSSMLPVGTPGPHVVIEVSDNGLGIPHDIVERIYDPFFTTKDVGKGTGLGLSTALGIVRSHGGFIDLQTEPGKGTTFRIHLPAAPEQEPPVENGAAEALAEGNGEWVLVVDDEEPIRTAVKTVLETHGYRALTAADGAEALAVFAQHSSRISVVITDIAMPYMDGIALIRALKKMAPAVVVIASSGQIDKARRAELKAMEIPALLKKPYGSEAVLRTVAAALTLSRGAPAFIS